MKTLLRLKEWLTIPDAARHLSIMFGEEVAEADVLRLALDGHLKLSVDFPNHAVANPGRLIPIPDARTIAVEFEGELVEALAGFLQARGEVLEFAHEIASIDGVWDLPMTGAERLDVEHRYQQLTGGPPIDLSNLEGPIVYRPDGSYFRIVESFEDNEYFDNAKLRKPWSHPDNFYPASTLPRDSVFVVRTSALQELEGRASEPEQTLERHLGRRERSTLLVIIAALAKLAKVDVAKVSSAATAIESQTVLMGARVASRTIENHLRDISDALEAKGGG